MSDIMKDKLDSLSQIVDVLDKRVFLLTLVAILLYVDCYLLYHQTSVIDELSSPSKSLQPQVWLPGCLLGVFGLFIVLPSLKFVVLLIGNRLSHDSTYSSERSASTKVSYNITYVKGEKLREMGVYQQNSIAYEEYKQYRQDIKTKQRIQDLCGTICMLVVWNLSLSHSLTRLLGSQPHVHGAILLIFTVVITAVVSISGWIDYIKHNYEEFSTLKHAPDNPEPLVSKSLKKVG